MLPNIKNRDIAETVNARDCGNLEDEIFQAVDKLQALCAVQAQFEASEAKVGSQIRNHYAMVLEDQAARLRILLERHFG